MSTETLISLSELGRRLNVTGPRIVDLHARGVIKADFQSSNQILFRPSRLKQIEAQIKADCSGLNRAIKARQAQLK